jgi:hypothetical protein
MSRVKKEKNITEDGGNYSLPSRVLILKSHVLGIRMPGACGGLVNKSFYEGQIVYDPDSIELLLKHDSPIEILS